MKKFLLAATLLCPVILTGCLNLFDPFDNPTSDAQLLSAARACFDKGDVTCARDLYGKLTPSGNANAIAENILTSLEENGVGMSEFMQFAGDISGGTSTGRSLSRLAGRIGKKNPGEAMRVALHSAFKSAYNDTTLATNPSLSNFMKFVTGLMVAAEILGEAAGSDGLLSKNEVVANSTLCTGATGSAANASCDAPSTGTGTNLAIGVVGALDITLTATTLTGATANIDQLFRAIEQAYTALNALGAGGSFGSTASMLSTLQALGEPNAIAVNNRVFRGNLLDLGVGE